MSVARCYMVVYITKAAVCYMAVYISRVVVSFHGHLTDKVKQKKQWKCRPLKLLSDVAVHQQWYDVANVTNCPTIKIADGGLIEVGINYLYEKPDLVCKSVLIKIYADEQDDDVFMASQQKISCSYNKYK